MRGRRLYKALAESSLDNAKLFLADARNLHHRGSTGHACSLAVLGIEEAAKAIIYKEAAEGIVRFVSRKPNNVSTYSEQDLLDHKFKHGTIARLLVGAIEYAPFQQTLTATRRQTFTRSDVESVLRQAHTRQWLQRTELQRGGHLTRELQLMFGTVGRLNDLKNGGLYVGRSPGGISRPTDFVRSDLKRIRELANIVVRTADQTVSTAFTARQRRELAEQMQVVAAQTRRLQRLSRKAKRAPAA